MPIYEYEPTEFYCGLCENRFEAVQSVDEPPLVRCPLCAQCVKRLISRSNVKMKVRADADKAAEKGLTTFRRTEKGKWEKVAGPGVDMIQGTDEDIASIETEKARPKVVDLDNG